MDFCNRINQDTNSMKAQGHIFPVVFLSILCGLATFLFCRLEKALALEREAILAQRKEERERNAAEQRNARAEKERAAAEVRARCALLKEEIQAKRRERMEIEPAQEQVTRPGAKGFRRADYLGTFETACNVPSSYLKVSSCLSSTASGPSAFKLSMLWVCKITTKRRCASFEGRWKDLCSSEVLSWNGFSEAHSSDASLDEFASDCWANCSFPLACDLSVILPTSAVYS